LKTSGRIETGRFVSVFCIAFAWRIVRGTGDLGLGWEKVQCIKICMRVGVLFLVHLVGKLQLCRTRIPDSSSDEGCDETTSDELN
jgi:hypothetical protein